MSHPLGRFFSLLTCHSTWTATDACGNSASAVQRITKVDTTAPVITVPADVSHECSVTVDTGVATATDNCDGAPVISHSDSVQAGACASSYVIVRCVSSLSLLPVAVADCDVAHGPPLTPAATACPLCSASL